MPSTAFLTTSPIASTALALQGSRPPCRLRAPRTAPAPCQRPRPARMQADGGGNDDGVVTGQAVEETTLDLETEVLDPSSGAVRLTPSPNLALGLLGLGSGCLYLGDAWSIAGFPAALLGTLLLFQTYNVMFFFGATRLSVAVRSPPLVGQPKLLRGWQFERMSNWIVWWPGFYLLGYFKEKESYDGRGSVHFLPLIFDGKQFADLLREKTPHLDQTLRADQDKSG